MANALVGFRVAMTVLDLPCLSDLGLMAAGFLFVSGRHFIFLEGLGLDECRSASLLFL